MGEIDKGEYTMTIEALATDPLRSALWWGLHNFAQEQHDETLTVNDAIEIIDRQVVKLREAGVVTVSD